MDVTKFLKPHLVSVKSNYETLTGVFGPKVVSDTMHSEELIRMFNNENPYPPSPKVLQAIKNCLPSVNRYPDPTYYYLTEKISEYTGLKPENIIVGNGSLNLIQLIYGVFVDSDDEVILPIPSFEQFEYLLSLAGGKPVYTPLQKPNFILEPEKVADSVSPRTKLIILINPHNPVGNYTPKETIRRILEEDAIVLVDEAYYEYCKKTVAPWVQDYENLIVLRTLSKAFGLAGLRVGYALANPELIKQLHKPELFFPINTLSLQAAIAALEDTEYAEETVSKTVEERERLTEELSKIDGLKPYPSETNFILVEITKENLNAGTVFTKLLENKIFIKNCTDQKGLGEKFFRVSVSSPENNKLFIETLKNIME